MSVDVLMAAICPVAPEIEGIFSDPDGNGPTNRSEPALAAVTPRGALSSVTVMVGVLAVGSAKRE